MKKELTVLEEKNISYPGTFSRDAWFLKAFILRCQGNEETLDDT